MSEANPIDMVIEMYPEIKFQKLLGIEILEAKVGSDQAKVKLPFRMDLAGGGKAYHGGVISSLIDLTGALATWVGHDPAKGFKASTVSLNIQFMAAALGQDIVATGSVKKRGKDLNFVDILVETEDGEKQVAMGQMVYRIVP